MKFNSAFVSFVFLLFVAPLSAQQTEDQTVDYEIRRDTVKREIVSLEEKKIGGEGEFVFRFDIGSAIFDQNFGDNKQRIAGLDSIMNAQNALRSVDSIVVNAASSIDGPRGKNAKLAEARAASVSRFMLDRYNAVMPQLLRQRALAEDWASLREEVVNDKNVPYKTEVLEIIDAEDRTLDAREWLLKILRGGKPWEYLKKNILPKQRFGASMTFYYDVVQEPRVRYEDIIVVDTMYYPKPQLERERAKVPFFALKTNLLFDAATILNVEVEVPIGNRWSVAGEWIFPWWINDNHTTQSKRNRLQSLTGTLEGRYWLGERTEVSLLTGWFVGAHATVGSFDFERDRKGYQSKDLVGGGLSAGYAHTINKRGNLRLEYALSLGYAQFTYKEYTAEFGSYSPEWDAFLDYRKSYQWFGPTRLKVSLAWMLNRKEGRKDE